MRPGRWSLCCLILGGLAVSLCHAQKSTFGVRTVAPFGLCGRIYLLPRGSGGGQAQTLAPDWMRNNEPDCTNRLPKFELLNPVGAIYTTQLNVDVRDFQDGFPGVTGRFEWFAIDYTARLWIQAPGLYSFKLLSDDGSRLYIDERLIVDNDCGHAPTEVKGGVQLDAGIHDIRVSYFQGPRFQVALVLKVKPPEGKWRVFDTREFSPPPGTPDLDLPRNPCQIERNPRKLITRP